MTRPDAGRATGRVRGMPVGTADARGGAATLAAILAQVSREALRGEGLDAVLQRSCDWLVRNVPVAIASIILRGEAGVVFVREVWWGELDVVLPAVAAGWPVSKGAAGRCVRLGQAQLIVD